MTPDLPRKNEVEGFGLVCWLWVWPGDLGLFVPESDSEMETGAFNFSSSHALLSSRTTSKMPILRTSALVTPNTRHARSFAARMVYGVAISVVKIA